MMKKLTMVLVLFAAVPAYAGSAALMTNTSQEQVAVSSSGSSAGASNAGNNQTIIFTSPGETESTVRYEGGTYTESRGTSTLKNVPSVSGPPLVSSNDTCMGSSSGSVNVAGFGGSYGSTKVDENCKMLKNSRELWNMGMRGAALARMCMDDENRESLELTGFTCPQTERDRQVAVEQATK